MGVNSAGKRVSGETELRASLPHHCGQSAPRQGAVKKLAPVPNSRMFLQIIRFVISFIQIHPALSSFNPSSHATLARISPEVTPVLRGWSSTPFTTSTGPNGHPCQLKNKKTGNSLVFKGQRPAPWQPRATPWVMESPIISRAESPIHETLDGTPDTQCSGLSALGIPWVRVNLVR